MVLIGADVRCFSLTSIIKTREKCMASIRKARLFLRRMCVCVYSISCLVTHSTIFQSAALDSVLRSIKNAASCFDFFNRREWERSCLKGIVYFFAAAIRTTQPQFLWHSIQIKFKRLV